MMNAAEMKAFLLDELKTERNKMLMNQPNDYGYIFMLCNDMGLTEDERPQVEEQSQVEEQTTPDEQPKRYVYTEKGAAAMAWRFPGTKAGDIYDHPVPKGTLRSYVRMGYIAAAV